MCFIRDVRCVSVNTFLAYQNDLKQFILMSFIGKKKEFTSITKNEIKMCLGELSFQKRSPASINRFLSAVRSLYDYAIKMGYASSNPSLEVHTIKNQKKLPNFLTGNEIDFLCKKIETTPLLWETRDKALVEMMYSSGCRLSEITNLKIEDFSNDYSKATVLGKGNKQRIVFFEKDAREALRKYLEDRDFQFTNQKITNPKNFLFLNQKGFPLSKHGVSFILSKYSGIEGTNHHVNPHALRHTFATAMITQGADVRKVQEMLGHSNISTTQRYTHLSTKQIISSYNECHPHGGKK